MKKLVYILLLCSLAAQSQNVHINGSGTLLSINSGGAAVSINAFFRPNTVLDNGYYDGFPMVSDVVNKSAWGIYKFSSSHGAGGSLMLIHTSNWGQNWTEDSITVDEAVIHSTNHSFIRLSSGRMIISYKPVGDTSLRFAYNDNDDSAFTSIATVITPSVNYVIAQCPNKMLETSYGTILFTYYRVGSNGNSNSAVIMESTDNGLSFSQKSIIYTSNNVYPTGFPDVRYNEFALCETHPTGVEATSKWIAICRPEIDNDGGGYYGVFKSSDGANTWTQDVTTDAGSFTTDDGTTLSSGAFTRAALYHFLASGSPVDILNDGDSIYVVNGNRNAAFGSALMYISATPDGAFENKFSNWVHHAPVMFYYNGSNPGSSFDNGYPVFFKSGGSKFVAQYKVSNLSPLPAVTRRVLIETVKIK